jgi:hypothetical protein
MSQYPVLGGGTRVDDQFLSDLIDNYVIKPADATPRTATTQVADTDLTFPAVAGAVYDVTFRIQFSALLAAGLATSWSVPSGTTGNRLVLGPGSGNAADSAANNSSMRTGVHAYTTVIAYTSPRNTISAQVWAEEKAVLSIGATSGAVTLFWGQWTANATGSLVNANSFVKYRRIG